jgi:hypothetical protein
VVAGGIADSFVVGKEIVATYIRSTTLKNVIAMCKKSGYLAKYLSLSFSLFYLAH